MNKLPDGFIKWTGERDYTPAGYVAIITRDGTTGEGDALAYSWNHNALGSDIIAYRRLRPQYDPKDVAFKDDDIPSAESYLKSALATMQERGKTYDSDSGERSMGKTIAAFNAITGRDLSEQEGWLLMLLLKQVRQWSTNQFHQDSALDSVAYAALLAESLANGK